MLAIAILIALATGLLVLGVVAYNKLVSLRNAADGAWAQIDVALKRRFDLIPNLVETVRGYAAHERETLDAVMAARSAATQADGPATQAQANSALDAALGRLFALSEAYPDLKASANFLALQDELVGTEDRVAYARQGYNDAVLALNTAIEVVPTRFFAGIARATPREFFDLPWDSTAGTAPAVSF